MVSILMTQRLGFASDLYLDCLAYYDEKKFDALSKTELDAIGSECQPYDEALRKSGHLIATGSL
jgi:hypothetical protein